MLNSWFWRCHWIGEVKISIKWFCIWCCRWCKCRLLLFTLEKTFILCIWIILILFLSRKIVVHNLCYSVFIDLTVRVLKDFFLFFLLIIFIKNKIIRSKVKIYKNGTIFEPKKITYENEKWSTNGKIFIWWTFSCFLCLDFCVMALFMFFFCSKVNLICYLI